MNLSRKHALAGLAATGIVASALAGGGVAVASTGPAPTPTMTATAPAHCKCGCGHMNGKWSGHQAVAQAVAGYLGLSPAQVRSQVESGKSLADVAKAQGKSVSGLEDTILGAVTTQVNASPYLSPAGKAAAISEVKSHLGTIVHASCKPGSSLSPSPTGTK